LAHYQQVLDSVTFSSGANPTNNQQNLTRTVAWTADDGSGANSLSMLATTTISVLDRATMGGSSVAENPSNGTVVGTVTANDPNVINPSYSLVSNAGGRFAINATSGQVTVANGTLIDFETATSHAITVRVTGQGGVTFDQPFTIAVTNVNEAPTGA